MQIIDIQDALSAAITDTDLLEVLYSLNLLEVDAIGQGIVENVIQEGIELRLKVAARMNWITCH